MDTDQEWEKWGNSDPYFGVITCDKYRTKNLTPKLKDEFFESGRQHIHHILDIIRRYLNPDFTPRKILDFGCGTGRLVIPFAEVAEHVVGLDVSDAMLKEAQKNCKDREINNIELLKSDDELTSLNGRYDLICSFMVFQHIPVNRGKLIFSRLLNHLNDGGICTVHFTYSKEVYRPNNGLPAVTSYIDHLKNTLRYQIKKSLSFVKSFLSSTQPIPVIPDFVSRDPEMQMNPYNLNELFFIIQSAGIYNIHTEFTDHGGELGVVLYFQKPSPSD